ncbi:MAG: bifunctional serine/threonine-protein kinase/formylglycine-generating enzyme family protein [Planctomycetota bacterium]
MVPRVPSDLQSFIAYALTLDDAACEAAIARFCQMHPSEDPIALRAAIAADSVQEQVRCREPNQDLERLRSLSAPPGRYEFHGEVARGGMGAILRVHDQTLGRHLAMKVILGQMPEGRGSTPRVDPGILARFVDEAQVTSQLDHPGVVPVHEIGLDAHGRVYFTMRLVKGRTADQVFGLARECEDGWTLTRALEVILKVCDTLAYAHQKGVIHRDLKPTNVMVGRFGEVYVMDWGLARVLGQPDRRDLRLRPATASLSQVETERSRRAASDPDSPLLTMDGAVVGTPSFMAPEQAAGKLDELGLRSDVYSVGAMLYALLTGRMPYVVPGVAMSPHTILGLVLQGPPTPIHQLDKGAPPQLVAVCEKAMARESEQRYADTRELAEELRAFLDQRVVKAFRTGPIAEARAWMRRNKLQTVLSALMMTAALVGVGRIVSSWIKADDAARLAHESLDRFYLVRDRVRLDEALAQETRLWPAFPEVAPAMRAWLAQQAEPLRDRLPELRAAREAMQKRALSWSEQEQARDREAHPMAARLREVESELVPSALPGTGRPPLSDTHRAALQREYEELRAKVSERLTYSFDDDADRFLFDTVSKLITDLEAFNGQGGVVAAVRARLLETQALTQETVDDHRADWEKAVQAVAVHATYGGLKISPQVGLIPLGPDPDSTLWEFGHLRSGKLPKRGADGKLELTDDFGIVFVLVPPGEFLMGAQSLDPGAEGYDPLADDDREVPPHRVPLAPFFLGKYELTQGQWRRITGGEQPSTYLAGERFRGITDEKGYPRVTERAPVESVDWLSCTKWLGQQGLRLPTDAEWEYACRSGTSTPWSTGRDPNSLEGSANVLDQFAIALFPQWGATDVEFRDGFAGPAPVGSYRPNAWGLHDLHGNVWEWCQSEYREGASLAHRVVRGAGYSRGAAYARSSRRSGYPPSFRDRDLGARAARTIRD